MPILITLLFPVSRYIIFWQFYALLKFTQLLEMMPTNKLNSSYYIYSSSDKF